MPSRSSHPDRMASRILGMGDVVSLVEKAQEVFDEKKAKEFERKLRKDEFTLEDFKEQIKQMKKLGSMESVIGMIPGLSKMKGAIDFSEAEKEIKRTEAIINSMTAEGAALSPPPRRLAQDEDSEGERTSRPGRERASEDGTWKQRR